MLELIFILALGVLLLNFGAAGLVQGSANIARKLGVPPLIIGLTIVAFGTSAPEFVVSFTASLKSQTGISIGNIIGSNIANLALILGFAAVIRPLKVSETILTRWLPLLLAMTILLFLFVDDGIFTWREGLVFCSLAAGVIWYSIHAARKGESGLPDNQNEVPEGKTKWLVDIGYVLIGTLLLMYGSNRVVDSGVGLMRLWGVSETVIGLTVIAIGTSLPELATSIMSAMKGETELCVGNVIGSNLFNTLFILGGVALYRDLQFEPKLIIGQMWILLGLTVLLFPILKSDRKVTKLEGAFLLSCYSVFLAVLLYK